MQLQRTTVRIKKTIFKTAKRLAVEKEVTLQEVINRALAHYPSNLDRRQQFRTEEFKFADKDMGCKLSRPLTRKDL